MVNQTKSFFAGCFPLGICLLLELTAFAQPSQKIEILNADALKLDTLHRAKKLVGNVKLRQDKTLMACDSALFYNNRNAVDAYGHVFIDDTETKVYADSLKYDGEKKDATLFGNVRVVQDSATLVTPKLVYNSSQKLAAYYEGGEVTARGMKITSRRGYYYTNTKNALFKTDVVVIGNDYDLRTDTLRYDTRSEISYFYGPTWIKRPGENVYCESGWYNTKTGISVFGKNTLLKSEAQKIWSDSLEYDSAEGFGKALKNFRWTDTTMNAILSGNQAVYYKEMQRITVTDSALLIYLVDDDSLFLTADTLRAKENSVTGKADFFAYPRVRIFKTNMQGVCDSLAFSFSDSIIKMFLQPVLWNDENQLTGDTIAIRLREQKLDRVELYENGFITSRAHDGLFNQIKGKRIEGYFKEKQLDRLLADGNGESIYYGKDEQEAFIGVNKAICSNMWIYLKKEQVSRITFLTKPEATFIPIQNVLNPKDFLLKGFMWKEELRPKSKSDLFTGNL